LARSSILDDSLLDTPNLLNYRGVLRWVIVQKLLKLASENDRFDGISAEWVDMGGVTGSRLRARACG
jgi:hypothetical protein